MGLIVAELLRLNSSSDLFRWGWWDPGWTSPMSTSCRTSTCPRASSPAQGLAWAVGSLGCPSLAWASLAWPSLAWPSLACHSLAPREEWPRYCPPAQLFVFYSTQQASLAGETYVYFDKSRCISIKPIITWNLYNIFIILNPNKAYFFMLIHLYYYYTC